MKRHFLALLAIVLAATALAAGLPPGVLTVHVNAQEPTPTLPQNHSNDVVCGGLDAPNLLQNPSFEGSYSAYVPPGGHPDCPTGICNTAQMAGGWTPYWRSHNPADPPHIIRMPEFKPAESWWDPPPRTHDGERGQAYFSFSSTHEAGFYQRVSVTPGEYYCFGIWGHAWSSSNDDPNTSDSELEQRIGIDPTGGTDWQSANVVWGGPRQYYNKLDDGPAVENAFGPFTLVIQAESSQLTVFTWSRPLWAVKHNDVYWDDAIFLRAPQTPSMSLSRHSISVLEIGEEAALYSIPVDISFVQDPGVTWTASVAPGNTLDVEIGPAASGGAAGTGQDDLQVSFDSSAYGPGSYSAGIIVVSQPAVPGSPATIEVSLHILEEVAARNYLPLYSR